MLAIAALAACGGSEPQPPPPKLVETVTTTRADRASEIAYPAQLRAADRGALSFEIGGVVRSVSVDIGDGFRAGQTLATLDPIQQRSAVEGVEAQIAEAVAAAEEAALDYERKGALAGTGAIAQSVIDVARRQRDQTSARASSLRAERRRLADNLSDTQLNAPYAGEVTARLVEPSEVVAAGQAVLQVSGRGSGLEAVVDIPDTRRDDFAVGQAVRFVAVDGTPLQARVTQLDSAAATGGLFQAILKVPNAREVGLRAGMRGTIRTTRDDAAAILLPITAVRARQNNEATVLVVDADSLTVSELAVRVGDVTDGGIEIVDGLAEGVEVVAKGAQLLRPGEEVRLLANGPTRFNP
ncbi:MAG: efflux RND transporter periplasmic adaptor subunit [Pacificimonas sp.]